MIVVEPQYVDAIMIQSDKHHMFARPTWREGDTKDDMEVLWLKRTAAPVPQEVRTARDKATRQAGADFRGITVRGNGDRLQIGLRLLLGAKDRIQHHFLPEDSLPIQQARGI